MSQQDPFLGAWRVRESVFAADGQYLGRVEQSRRLSPLDDGDVLVSQTCQPESALGKTAMAAFTGDFTFRLSKDGTRRTYLGPDVLGGAQSIGGEAMVGEGVWPKFGYSFRSWSISIDDSLQLTGGRFFQGDHTVAVIVGLGQPEDDEFLTLPSGVVLEAGSQVSGTSLRVDHASGHCQSIEECGTRTQLAGGSWQEHWQEAGQFQMERQGSGFTIKDQKGAVGTAHCYGPSLHWDLYDAKGGRQSGIEILSPLKGVYLSLRRRYERSCPVSYELIRWR